MSRPELAEIGAKLLGSELRSADALHGGSLSQILEISLTDVRTAVVKSGPAPGTEAGMLDAIAASGAPVPRVLAVNDAALVIERLPAGGSLQDAWASLGAATAELHRSTGARYGWFEDYAFATVRIANAWSEDWPRFWAERRLLLHSPRLPSALARRVDTLAGDLQNRLPQHPTPSLLHGDLWGGNVLVDAGRVTGLIDPACYYGHCEVDIAMLALFDQPNEAFFAAYGGLESNHRERLPIYQLWPALVHWLLFGRAYESMVGRLLSAAGV